MLVMAMESHAVVLTWKSCLEYHAETSTLSLGFSEISTLLSHLPAGTVLALWVDSS